MKFSKPKARGRLTPKPGALFILGGGLAALFLLLISDVEAQRDYIDPIPVTATQLADAYKRNFHQADAAYTGKLLMVTGRVKSIKTPAQRPYNYQFDKIYAFMTLESGRGNLPLGIYFWDWEAEKINRLRVGNTVTVMGFCQGVPPHLSLIEACLYPNGCGGPRQGFEGPYYELPPSPPPRR